MSHAPVPSAPVDEIERRIRWPALPAILFVGIMIALGVAAVLGARREPPYLSGLPDDPDVAAARDAVRDVRFDAGPLRFHGALFVDAPMRDSHSPPARARGVDAESPAARAASNAWGVAVPTPQESQSIAIALDRLERAAPRHRRDPRVAAAIASLDLVGGSLERAERRYRVITDHAPGYGEARLGLGVTLATKGARSVAEREQRRWWLQAIAQLAAVRPKDPVYAAALHDRIVLLERVGRGEEAERLAKGSTPP